MGAPMDQAIPMVRLPGDDLEQFGILALFGVAGAVQFSIAAAQLLLAAALLLWIAMLIVRHERFEAPSFFWPLVFYAAATVISASFSSDPRTSLVDCKQLVLFSIVPLTYRLVSGRRGGTASSTAKLAATEIGAKSLSTL